MGEGVGKVKEVLDQNYGQILWTILHCSLFQKLGYHLLLVCPSDIKVAAQELDPILCDMLENTTSLHIPKLEEGLGVEFVLDLQL
jgi:hypothetical protein